MGRLQYLKKIESRRLIVRPVMLSDTLELYQAILASKPALEIWQPFARGLCFKEFSERQKKQVLYWAYASAPVLMFVFIYKKNGRIVGAGGYNKNSNHGEKSYELTYWADSRFEGKGFITEAANLLSRYALEALEAKEVVICMKKDNIKSKLVAKRLNFDFQGEVIGESCPWLPKNHDRNYRYALTELRNLPALAYYYEESHELSPVSVALEWSLNEMHSRSIIVDILETSLVVQTPWSVVVRLVTTEKESYYLKMGPRGLGNESGIFKLLKEKIGAKVPAVIANNEELNAFISEDLGESLRAFLAQGKGKEYLEQAVKDFALLQKNSCYLLEDLDSLKVPYWGLDVLAEKALDLFSQRELLLSDGMSVDEYHSLRKTLDIIKTTCDELNNFGLPMALVQCDFHDNNIVIRQKENQRVGFIDLGEIVISHPFFSIFNFINQIKKHHYHLISENELDNFYSVYCQVWEFHTTENFKNAISVLWPIYEALCQQRLYQSCDNKKLREIQKGKLSSRLKDFLTKTKNISLSYL